MRFSTIATVAVAVATASPALAYPLTTRATEGEAETGSAQGVQSAGPTGGHRGHVHGPNHGQHAHQHGPNHGKHAHPQGAGALAARNLDLEELYARNLDLEELYAREGEAETGSAQGVQSAGPSGRPGHVHGPNHGQHAHQHGPNHGKHAHPQGAGALAARDFDLEELYARDLDLEELYARDLELEELYAREGEAETGSAQGVQSAGPSGRPGHVHGPNHGKHAAHQHGPNHSKHIHPQGAGALAARDFDLEELYAREGEAEAGSAQSVQSAGPPGHRGHVHGPNHGQHAHQHGPNHGKHAHSQGAGALAARDFDLEELYAREGEAEAGSAQSVQSSGPSGRPGHVHGPNHGQHAHQHGPNHGKHAHGPGAGALAARDFDLDEILARSFYDELD
ncbi:hypothetical protein C8Q72DRAFT_879697 [Fomitopsis betulina]|nr:hypothetical protein C8Q72DRAFT_879697 [Fomitopsis betulina]